MRNLARTGLMIVMVFSLVSIALARAAPTKQEVFSPPIVSAHVAPAVVNVPPMTDGYDVICNFTLTQTVRADTSATSRLSTPVDWRSRYTSDHHQRARSGPEPALVLLA